MVNWQRRLQAASFNGLPFHVESDEIEGGHRVSTTGIPNGRHVNEGFGPAARKFEIEAYIGGDFAYDRAMALVAAAESRHLGVLILPSAGSSYVRLTKAKRKYEKDKLGYVTVSLEAVAEPDNSGLSLSANALEARIYALTGLIGAAFGAFGSGAFRIVGQPSTVVDKALTAAAGSLGDLVALREEARLSPALRDQVKPAFDQAYAALSTFPVIISADPAAQIAAGLGPAAFAAALAGAAIALGDAADPAQLAQSVVAFGRPVDPPPPQVSRGTALIITENAVQAVALTAASRALVLGEAMARRTYVDRPEAVNARAISTAIFDDALARIGRAGLDLARDLATIKGVLGELVTRREADLAPIITVSAPLRLPSLVWAWRLYADPQRAEDLADRAGAFNPAAMPERFDALAS